MSKTLKALAIATTLLLSSCTRDLSSDMYTSNSTLSLTMEGVIVSAREVIIKDSDLPGNSENAAIVGGLGGMAIGSSLSSPRDQGRGALIGTAIGAGAGILGNHVLSKSKGYEYIIKVDTSKLDQNYYHPNKAAQAAVASAVTNGLITVVQGKNQKLPIGSKVYVIFSDNRARVIPIN